MSAPPSSMTPMTPVPEPDGSSGLEPKEPSPLELTAPSTASSDELNLLLSRPTPDPYLADSRPDSLAITPEPEPNEPATSGRVDSTEQTDLGPSSDLAVRECAVPIRLSSEERARPRFDQAGENHERGSEDDEEAASGVSWPLLLLASYASAVTLALGWILWTGRSLLPRSPAPDAAVSTAAREPVGITAPTAPNIAVPLPEIRLTSLDGSVRVGDVEVAPLRVVYRRVELERLAGAADDRRETEAVLCLRLRLTNHSHDAAFAPLDAAIVRDSAPGADQPCVALGDGQRVPLLRLAPESEWSIVGQDFPTLRPGETAETLLVSEPLPKSLLKGPMVWHVKVRSGPFQTDVLGVRFSSSEIVRDDWDETPPGDSP